MSSSIPSPPKYIIPRNALLVKPFSQKIKKYFKLKVCDN
nr:MAG TPA: hypothetical protein [Caudoviricetes sp.]